VCRTQGLHNTQGLQCCSDSSSLSGVKFTSYSYSLFLMATLSMMCWPLGWPAGRGRVLDPFPMWLGRGKCEGGEGGISGESRVKKKCP
jgi:hypothetical protein